MLFQGGPGSAGCTTLTEKINKSKRLFNEAMLRVCVFASLNLEGLTLKDSLQIIFIVN